MSLCLGDAVYSPTGRGPLSYNQSAIGTETTNQMMTKCKHGMWAI